jgi:hypothetical protein
MELLALGGSIEDGVEMLLAATHRRRHRTSRIGYHEDSPNCPASMLRELLFTSPEYAIRAAASRWRLGNQRPLGLSDGHARLGMRPVLSYARPGREVSAMSEDLEQLKQRMPLLEYLLKMHRSEAGRIFAYCWGRLLRRESCSLQTPYWSEVARVINPTHLRSSVVICKSITEAYVTANENRRHPEEFQRKSHCMRELLVTLLARLRG